MEVALRMLTVKFSFTLKVKDFFMLNKEKVQSSVSCWKCAEMFLLLVVADISWFVIRLLVLSPSFFS